MEGTPALILDQVSGKSDLMSPNSSIHPEAYFLLRHMVLVSKTYLISSMCPIAKLNQPYGPEPFLEPITNGRIFFCPYGVIF